MDGACSRTHGKGNPPFGQLGRRAFLLGGKAFRWLNGGVRMEVFTPESLPPPQSGRFRYGVIGSPIAHSLSPAMQLAGFQAAGLDAEYFRIEIPKDDLAKAIPRLLEAGFQGWNCTLPHKTEMFRIVTQKDPSAIEAQSVNTVRVEGRQLHGFSTDAGGWEAAIQETWAVPLNNLQILILGCGGVGQSIARRLARSGCGSLILMNRDPRRAELLNLELKPIVDGRFPLSFLPWTDANLETTLKKTDLIVQATSLGLRETDPLPIPAHFLNAKLKVYDTIYRKGFTPLVRASRERGCSAEDGLAMLLQQGILSWEIWTGKTAPKAAMRQALWQAAEREK